MNPRLTRLSTLLLSFLWLSGTAWSLGAASAVASGPVSQSSTPHGSARVVATSTLFAQANEEQGSTRIRGRSVRGLVRIGILVVVAIVAVAGYLVKKITGQS